LKKVAGKKQRDIAEQDAELKKRREALEAKEQKTEAPDESSGPADILAAEDDEDVIF
jgi:V-type H+-transporting ATPase subunit D